MKLQRFYGSNNFSEHQNMWLFVSVRDAFNAFESFLVNLKTTVACKSKNHIYCFLFVIIIINSVYKRFYQS